jgi:glycerophosphoryl diester phosphodiesterase
MGSAGAVEVIAHRGFSARAPENTMVAIEAAIAHGADAVEFDVHVTRDGVPVLFHDATLERTTNASGPVRERSYDELRGLDAGSWFAPRFAGEPIPSLEDALSRIDARVARVYPEVKGYREPRDLDRMVDLVVERAMVGRTAFISMDWRALDRMRDRHTGLTVGYIVEKAGRALQAIERVAGDSSALLDFKASLLLDEPSLAERALEAGIELAVWTVDDPKEAERLLALGVYRITTNRVTELVAWKESR